VPRFRGGLHGGTVTAGELGDLRQQIVFVGDILNTAARLEEYAKRTGRELVISGELLDRLPLPPWVEVTPCGDLAIKGKEARVAAYSVTGAPAYPPTTLLTRQVNSPRPQSPTTS
jgi:adenylate cyclase